MPRPPAVILSLFFLMPCLLLLSLECSYGQDSGETQGSFRNPLPQRTSPRVDAESNGNGAALHDPLPRPAAPEASFAEVMTRVAERERDFNQRIRQFRPIVETYLQTLKDQEIGPLPVGDRYFLGRLDLAGAVEELFRSGRTGRHAVLSKLNLIPRFGELYGPKFLATGFAQMVVLDSDFQTRYYNFTYVRREFLGEVRCLVVDVQPRENAGEGRFIGRIWIEDQDYNIVRFNGTYRSRLHPNSYFHFESWRLNLQPGLWLPTYVFSEEAGDEGAGDSHHFRAQIRLWGYELLQRDHKEEFTKIGVESAAPVADLTDVTADPSPVESERLWAREAEDNALEKLQKVGLVSPEGEVEDVVQTVINNLILTNNLTIQPEVRTRMLLTTPLESFTIGHTIVLSRGLLDVLPDEPSLAMILAHELAHIALDHPQNIRLAFNDRMFFADEDTFGHLVFRRKPAEEAAADAKALALLANSPYKDKLGYAGLFLRALEERAPQLKNLIQPHLGSRIVSSNGIRMSALLGSAPSLEPRRMDQIAALPLGSRIKLDPWNNRTELSKGRVAALTTPREKMPFELAPFFPYLTRWSQMSGNRVVQSSSAK